MDAIHQTTDQTDTTQCGFCNEELGTQQPQTTLECQHICHIKCLLIHVAACHQIEVRSKCCVCDVDIISQATQTAIFEKAEDLMVEIRRMRRGLVQESPTPIPITTSTSTSSSESTTAYKELLGVMHTLKEASKDAKYSKVRIAALETLTTALRLLLLSPLLPYQQQLAAIILLEVILLA